MSTIETSAVLLPLVLMGKITHKEADIIKAAVYQLKVPETTREIQKQFENILGRKL